MYESEKSRKVAILQSRLPAYREDFFNDLFKMGLENGIYYEVYIDELRDKSRSDEITIKPPYVRHVRNRNYSILGRKISWRKFQPNFINADLVVTEYGIRNIQNILMLKIFRRKPTAFWGHGNHYGNSYSWLERKFRNRLSKIFPHYFVYTKKGKIYLEQLGLDKENIYQLNNTSNTKNLLRHLSQVDNNDVDKFVSKNNLENSKICVFIGSLVPSKRLDFLIEAANKIRSIEPEFKLLIFGEGPCKDKITDKKSDSFEIMGRADLVEMAIISKIAKFILMPGLIGLVAVDSLFLEIPIITTNWDYHSPEFEYLENDLDCIVTKDDLSNYVEIVLKSMSDSDLIIKLKKGCRQKKYEYTIENMVKSFHEGVTRILAD